MPKSVIIALIAAFLILTGCRVCFGEESGGVEYGFVLPPSYPALDALKKDIPADKPVLIYLVSGADLDAFDKGKPFLPELTFRGVTQSGGTELRFRIPTAMTGREYAVLALVVLDTAAYPDFDLTGQRADLKINGPDRIVTGIANESEHFFTTVLTPSGRTFTFDLYDAYESK